MNLDFNKEEFESLIKMVYLGNWMINANKEEGSVEKYNLVQDKVFSKAQELNLSGVIEEHENKFSLSEEFKEKAGVNKIHDEYDEDTFWGELVDRLAMKEFSKKYSEDEISKMSIEERISKSAEFFEKYEKEIEDNGLDNINLV